MELGLSREEIVNGIKNDDELLLYQIYEYLKKVQCYHINTVSCNKLNKEDFEEITEDVMMDVRKNYIKDDKDIPFDAFLRIAYRRYTIEHISKTTGVPRVYFRNIKQIKEVSEKYNLAICKENYYKFHRLTGITTYQIAMTVENYWGKTKTVEYKD